MICKRKHSSFFIDTVFSLSKNGKLKKSKKCHFILGYKMINGIPTVLFCSDSKNQDTSNYIGVTT